MRLPSFTKTEPQYGVSLTPQAIRAVAVKAGVVTQSVSAELPLGSFSLQTISVETIKAALAELYSQLAPDHAYVSIGVPESFSFSRVHTLPKMPLKEVTEALYWQLETIFPLGRDDVYYDWKLLSTDNNQLEVMVVAMPRPTLDKLLECFEAVGWRPTSFEPSASSLGQVLKLGQSDTTILIELSSLASSATLIEKGVTSLSVTSCGNGEDYRLLFQQTVQAVQSLLTYKTSSSQSDETISIAVCGEAASQEVAAWFSQVLAREVTQASISGVANEFLPAYAAAMLSARPSEDGSGINLLPTQVRSYYLLKRKRERALFALKWIAVTQVVVVIVMIMAAGTLFGRTMQLTQTLDRIRTTYSTQTVNAQTIAQLNRQSQSVLSLFARKTTPVALLQLLDSIVPEGIRVTAVSYDSAKKSLEIQGIATTRQNLVTFREVLLAESQFEKVVLPLEFLETPTNVNFTMTVTYTNLGGQ